MKFETYEYNFNTNHYLQNNTFNQEAYDSPYQQYICEAKTSNPFYKKKTSLVSIIIPAYNVENWLTYTLDSVINQTYTNWECIVIDDFSQDNTLEIIKEYRKKDSRIKFFPHRANGKLSAARNMGLILAKGDYICFLDSDDLLMPESLSNRLSAILNNNNPRLAGSYSGSKTIDELTQTPPKSQSAKNMRLVDFIVASGMCPFNANQPMFRTSVLRDLGGFDTRFTQAEDWEFWLRILRHGYHFIPSNKIDVTYRQTPGSMVKKEPLQHLETASHIFNSIHNPIHTDKVFSCSPFVYKKPWIDYKRQLDFANRTLEFCGMDIARTNQTEPEAVSAFHKILPDFEGAILPHRDMNDRLLVGIKRQLGNLSDSSIKYQCRQLINDFTSKTTSVIQNCSQDYEISKDICPRTQTPGFQRKVDIVFLPHKDYHLWSFSHFFKILEKNNINYAVVDISVVHRDEGVRDKALELNIPLIEYSEFILGEFAPKLMVCMNDWDPLMINIINQSKKVGISTLAIVEGIQDYNDADTGRQRNAYKLADHIILPGKFDMRYFQNTNQNVVVGGVTRIDELILEAKSAEFPKKPLAIINSNFTYNVLTEHRDRWVAQAVEACKKAGIDYIISKHPADQGDFSEYKVSNDTMYNLIRQGTLFISRFGSGIFESLAMGKPAIYFNPHNEKVDKFKFPQKAYEIANSTSELVKAIKSTIQNKEAYLSNADKFLMEHCGTNSESHTISATQKANESLLKIYNALPSTTFQQRSKLKYLLISNYHLTVFPSRNDTNTNDSAISALLPRNKVNEVTKGPNQKAVNKKYKKFKKNPHLFFADMDSPLKIVKYLFPKK